MRLRLCSVLGLVLVLALSQSACFGVFGGSTATEKFARDNKAFQVALQETDKTINVLMDAKPPMPSLTPAQVANLYERALIPLNTFHRELLLELIGYLEVDKNGKETLVLTTERRERLDKLTGSLLRLSQKALDSFGQDISSQSRAEIMLALSGIVPLVVRMQGLIGQFKKAKDGPVSLRALAARSQGAEISVVDDHTVKITLPAGTLAGLQSSLALSLNLKDQLAYTQLCAEVN